MKEKAIAFGCGDTAEKFFSNVCETYDIVAFSDNNESLWGGTKFGLPIIPPDQIDPETAIVVMSHDYYREIIHQLNLKGCKKILVYYVDQIFDYHNKSEASGKLAFGFPQIKAKPQILQISLSGNCNIKCRYCPFHSEHSNYYEESGTTSFDVVVEMCRQLKGESFQSLHLVGNGEPLMNPKWDEYISYIVSQCNIPSITIYTNGMLLNEGNIQKLKNLDVAEKVLCVSIDGISPVDTQYWRKGSDFDVIKSNLHRVHEELGNDVFIAVPSVIVLPATLDYTDEVGVEAFLESSRQWLCEAFPFAHVGTYLAAPYPTKPIPQTQIVDASVFPQVTHCRVIFNTIAISSNGDILACPCGYIAVNKDIAVMGNVLKDNILDVWYGNSVINEIRDKFLKGEKPVQCKACYNLGGDKIRTLIRTESDDFYR